MLTLLDLFYSYTQQNYRQNSHTTPKIRIDNQTKLIGALFYLHEKTGPYHKAHTCLNYQLYI